MKPGNFFFMIKT